MDDILQHNPDSRILMLAFNQHMAAQLHLGCFIVCLRWHTPSLWKSTNAQCTHSHGWGLVNRTIATGSMFSQWCTSAHLRWCTTPQSLIHSFGLQLIRENQRSIRRKKCRTSEGVSSVRVDPNKTGYLFWHTVYFSCRHIGWHIQLTKLHTSGYPTRVFQIVHQSRWIQFT